MKRPVGTGSKLDIGKIWEEKMTKSTEGQLNWGEVESGEEQGMGCGGQFYSLPILRYEAIQYLVISHRTRKGG